MNVALRVGIGFEDGGQKPENTHCLFLSTSLKMYQY